ncbi:TRAP transporter small permease [Marinomonas primoryensis]|uniref:TRAP transporter small permease protein n=1 Tax=Marinomonas primoryensis TaxID=178399 RepID=A0A859CZ29_9GAMM|nr:TRAP transporter small permease [Marinomonas primoryensis]QKK81858.1 uncharacterized protein MP3633_3131 [Marinomonas primoryensis]
MYIKIKKTIDLISDLSFNIGSLMLGGIVIVFCTEIVMRYFFVSPTSWGPDTITYLFCASLMLTMPEVTKNNEHISISVILDFSSEKVGNYIQLILYAISFFIIIYTFHITFLELVRLFDTEIRTLGAFSIPKWWVFIFIPFSLLLTSCHFLLLFIKRAYNIKSNLRSV